MNDIYYRGVLHWEEAIGTGQFKPKSEPFKPYSRINILNGQMTMSERRINSAATRSRHYGPDRQQFVRNFRRTYERTKGWESFTP